MALSEKIKAEYKKDRCRNNHYKYTYKITLDDFRDKLISQDFKCKICERTQVFCGKLQMDHCHKTSKIRFLLCRECNQELARFEKNGSVSESRSHLVDPNTEYANYLKTPSDVLVIRPSIPKIKWEK